MGPHQITVCLELAFPCCICFGSSHASNDLIHVSGLRECYLLSVLLRQETRREGLFEVRLYSLNYITIHSYIVIKIKICCHSAILGREEEKGRK